MSKLSKYKFIVNTGCSYGKMLESTLTPFNHIPEKYSDKLKKDFGSSHIEGDIDNVIGITVHCGSMGSDWQSDSIIYVVNQLLNLGVKSKNIYCFIEWSQWHRVCFPIMNYMEIDTTVLKPTSYPAPGDMPFIYKTKSQDNFISIDSRESELFEKMPNELKDLLDNINIGNTYAIGNVGHINNNFYVNPAHSAKHYFSDISLDIELYFDIVLSIENKLSPDIKIKNHLDNIIKTQSFLNSKNIEWNSIDMQSFQSNWLYAEFQELHNQFNISDDKTKLIASGNFGEEEPNNLYTKNIEELFPNLDYLFKQINSCGRHYFYQSKNYNRGGIDEFVIDNFKEVGFVNLTSENFQTKDVNVLELIPGYSSHPNFILYMLLWNEAAKNCKFLKVKKSFEEFIIEKFWEDYNHPTEFSKNGITISRQTWAQLTKIDNNE